jgi:hypothetical protein
VGLLLRQLRKERDSLAAMLLAGWVMINAHSMMEINFSVRAYQCVAMAFLAVAIIANGNPLFKGDTAKTRLRAKRAGIVLQGTLCLYMAVFGGLLISHRTVNEEAEAFSGSSLQEYMAAWRSYVRRDVFTASRHKLNFVGNAVLTGEDQYREDVERWVEDLRRSGTYENCSGLARYYYLPLEEYEEMFACSREGIAQGASSPDSWNLQMNFYRSDVLLAIDPQDVNVYLDGVLALKGYLDAYNATRMDVVCLTQENETFVTVAEALRNSSAEDEEIYMALIATLTV